jgi:hypothetical protein
VGVKFGYLILNQILKLLTKQTEKTQNMTLKNLLGVHGKASNLAVPYQLGTFPVVIKSYRLIFKYYLRLKYINEQCDGPHDLLRGATELKKVKDNNSGKLLFYSKISENFELKICQILNFCYP